MAHRRRLVNDEAGMIRSDRLELQPMTLADADEMVEVLADPRLYEFIGGHPPSLDKLRDRYQRLLAGPSADRHEEWRNWTVRRRSDGRAIGTVQATITDERQRASIAWVIGVPWQGQGYATEATLALIAWLDTEQVTAITANIHPDHRASAAVAERAGLVPTDELVDGELVWRRPQPKHNADSQTRTDESG
jgi:RimJ/RimL family protein N-acetyltransferase